MYVVDELYAYEIRYTHRTTRDVLLHTFHAHQGLELLFIFEGRVRIVIDEVVYEPEPLSLVILQPFQLHRIEPDPLYSYTWTSLIVNPTFIDQLLVPLTEARAFFQSLCKEPLLGPVVQHPDLTRLFRDATEFLPVDNSEREYRDRYGMFTLSLIQALQWLNRARARARQMDESSTLSVRTNPYAEKIMNWINAHFDKPIELAELAEMLHLSPYYISHLFHEVTGQTITQYILERRMNEACFLLQTTKRSVQEIGEAVGMPNPSHFSQVFRKQLGVSPRHYRLNAVTHEP